MARGGFISVGIAVNRIFKVVFSRDDSRKLLSDALISGVVHARGRPRLEGNQEGTLEDVAEEDKGNCTSAGKSVVLRDLAFSLSEIEEIFGEIEDIPLKFWTSVPQRSWDRWDCEDAQMFSLEPPGKTYLYRDIVVHEKELNLLIKGRQERNGTSSSVPSNLPREHRRHRSWEDWVAAVAILAYEQQIDGGMSRKELLDRINVRLGRWGLDGKEESTVGPTARAILDRWAKNPPIRPLMPIQNYPPKP